MKPVGIGIVGCGMICECHIRAIRAIPRDLEIVAVCDRNPDRAESVARQYGISRACSELDSVLGDPRIDAVFLLLPHNLHASACKQSLSRGKHVLLEKPIAATVEDSKRIIALEEQYSPRLMVANNLVFHPVIAQLRAMIANATLGILTHCEVRSHGWFQFRRASNFRLSRERSGGGALIDTGIHFIYLMRSLFGEMHLVQTMCTTALNDQHDFVAEGDDLSVSIFSFESGMIGSMTISYSTKIPGWTRGFPAGWEQDIAIYGSRGSVRVSIPFNSITLYTEGGKEEWVPVATEKDPQAAYLSSYSREIEHFLDCLQERAQPMKEMTASSSARDLAIIDQAYRSNLNR
jgi:predicted dehydrogenase